MEKASKIISRREFDWLCQFTNHTPEEKEKLDAYVEEREKNVQFHKINKPKIEYVDGTKPNKASIWHMFRIHFHHVNGKPFEQTPDSLKNIEPIIKYFAKDPTFFDCDNLVKSIDGSELKPSFEKGILIIGDYGNGKTSIFRSLSEGFTKSTEQAKREYWKTAVLWNNLRFNSHNANDVVTEYESIERSEYKEDFFKKYSGFRLYFDDFKNEKTASNFGKTEIFREILENRYNKKAKTFITMNYDSEFPRNLNAALDSIAKRYGNHVYDRVFEMFNIIEFKGKSFRL